MTIGLFDFRPPIHPTVAAEFFILKFAGEFRWGRRDFEPGEKWFENGHPTMDACEKSALAHLRSMPPHRAGAA